MKTAITTSVVITTYNRACHLTRTLEALASIDPSVPRSAELIVVDNASTDNTQEVVNAYGPEWMPVRYVYEPRRGQTFARNTGLAATQGEVILFMDDDVWPCSHWLDGMTAPILSGAADAVAGAVRLAPDLLLPWMTANHRRWLAETDGATHAGKVFLVGANMGFSRHVLEKVPGFDTETGPGQLGFCDDTLFSMQLNEAGYRLIALPEVDVEHHFDARRLTRKSFLNMARARGRSAAYVDYHWEHRELKSPQAMLAKALAKYVYHTGWKQRRRREDSPAPEWELTYLARIHYFRHYLRETRRPRNYDQHGLAARAAL